MVGIEGKTEKVKEAALKIEGSIMTSSFVMNLLPVYIQGFIQTYFCEFHRIVLHNLYPWFVYDSSEIFTLSDGGEILIEYLGEMEEDKPLLLLFPGMLNDS
jgi:hypothetical protein